ncbi:MAG: hypothetical protein HZA36_03070 [Parcubacteria group bacterium]|nr:hypothetical protein [Parcubacteria group bacterium]
MRFSAVVHFFFSLVGYVLAFPAFAAGLKASGKLQDNFYQTKDLEPLTSPARLVNGLSIFFSTLFLAVSIWFFFLAGYKYMTANGEAEKFTEARKNMVYAMIGLVVGLGAYAMPQLISTFLLGAPGGFGDNRGGQ